VDEINAEKSARNAYQSLAKVVRAIFKDDKARLTALRLSGTTYSQTTNCVSPTINWIRNDEAQNDLKPL
jgi:hypothetical protein